MLLEESEYGESWTVTQLMTFFLCLETVLERDRANQNQEVRHQPAVQAGGRMKSPRWCRGSGWDSCSMTLGGGRHTNVTCHMKT